MPAMSPDDDRVARPDDDRVARLEAHASYWQAEYEYLVQHLPNAVFLVDPTSDRIIEANEAACRLLGYPLDKLLEEVRISDIHPDQMDRLNDFAAEVMSRGVASTDQLGCLSAHGHYIPVLIHGAMVQTEDGRTLIRMIVVDDLRKRLAEQALLDEVRDSYNYEEITGRSKALHHVLEQVTRVAPTDSTVLILGETGTGKELICRAVHQGSERRARPLIKLNCAAIPSGLIESELFGHEKGAFTGAIQQKRGRFELAHEGTIFLDEIGDIPLETQPKLLRLIQEQQFERVGGTATIDVDVRIIAATHRDLSQMVADGTFREDLFYRLDVFPIQLPPLRERHDDIPLLARYFVHRQCTRLGRPVAEFTEAAMCRLQSYAWPGNIRELENIIARAVILCDDDRIDLDQVQIYSASASDRPPRSGMQTLEQVERDHIIAALSSVGGKISGPGGAAEILGLKPTTLESRMKKLGVDRASTRKVN